MASSTRKRKALQDLTNEHDLIPTSVLRKLVSATSNRSSVPLNSILKSTIRNNQVSCSGSENTSIGSSNVSAARASKTVGFRTPGKDNVGRKDGIRNLTRQAVQKSFKNIEAGSLNDVLSLEKRKDKGNKVVTPASLPRSTNREVKESTISVPFGSLGKEKKTPEFNLSSFRGPVTRSKELGDGSSNHASCSYQNTDKRKATLIDSSCLIEETEERGKATEKKSTSSIEKTYDRKKAFLKPSGSSVERSRAKAKEILISPTPLVDKTKEKGKAILHTPGTEMGKKTLISSPLLVDRTKAKGKAILLPPDRVEMEKDVRDGNNIPPLSNKIGKQNIYALTSSCPAIPRAKKSQSSDLSEGGSSKSSKAWTGPDPKTRQKKGSRLGGHSELPLDFVQQQKAYFEEIDAFELPVEEASENESD